jgi:hypothetical protein
LENEFNSLDQFILDEYEKLLTKQKELRDEVQDYLNNIQYAAWYGKISFIAKLHSYLEKMKVG